MIKPLKILLVEDHFIMRKFLETYLSEENRVFSFANGLEALNWLENNNQPDVMIIDMNMPEMSGQEFLQYIKCSNFFKNIPVIIVSGSEPEQINQFEHADAFISKPFDPSYLKDTIETILNR